MKKIIALLLLTVASYGQTTIATNLKITNTSTQSSDELLTRDPSTTIVGKTSKATLQDILSYLTASSLPVTGVIGKLYFTADDGKYYKWESPIYKEFGAGGSGSGTVTSVSALTIGTSGTNITSSVANPTTTPVITLNVPTASASNRGALSSADWSTFNGKQNALGFTPLNSSNNLSDLASASTARTNLGLGTLATQSGTFSDKVDKVTGKSLIDDTEITRLAGVTNFDNSGNVTALAGKADKVSITGATKTKITYNAQGIVTSGTDATTADINDSTNKRYQTDAQQTNNDATSSIQGQLNGKQSTLNGTGFVKSTSGVISYDTNTYLTTVNGTAITPTSVNSVVVSGASTPTLAVTGTTTVSGANSGDNATNSQYSGLASSKENTANKQNSLTTDGTGIKFPTVDAVNAGLALKTNISTTVQTTKTASYTLALTDAGTIIPFSNATSVTVTVPTNASVAFPIGTVIGIYSVLGQINTSNTGVTITGLDVWYTGDFINLIKTDTNTWVVQGNGKRNPNFISNVYAPKFNSTGNAGFVFNDAATGMSLASSVVTFSNWFNLTNSNAFNFNPIYLNPTSGNTNILNFSSTINPTSGTATFNGFNLSPTINQTGGANGITRGLYINPTLTSALDFRAIEVTAGKVIVPLAINSNEAVRKSQLDQKDTGQIIVTSGPSFITPPTITTATVFNIELIGGGGAGGGGISAGSGSGGGAGGYVFKRLTGLLPSNTYICSIGTGGTSAGTATTLTIGGTTYTANGGGIGNTSASSAGGAGGTAINGDLNIDGQSGDSIGTATNTGLSARGGSTAKGWGNGGPGVSTATNGNNATGYGGGGGAGRGASTTGGQGSQGIIFCQWFN